jgi:DNA topoisomerase-1
VKAGKINATLPKDVGPEAVTLEQALELIAARAGKPVRPKKAAKAKAGAKPKTAKAKTPKTTTAEAAPKAKHRTRKKPAEAEPVDG